MNSGVIITPDLFLSYLILCPAFSLILLCILFKLAVVPFHAWIAEGYSGMPLYTTALVVLIPKVALLSILFRLYPMFYWSFDEAFPLVTDFLASASLLVGGLGGICETNILRVIGFSSIANIAYIIAPLQTCDILAFQASLLYFIAYSITVLNIFSFMFVIRMPNNTLVLVSIRDFIFLKSHPYLKFLFCVSVFSLAGLPPLSGFFAKLLVFESLIACKSYFIAILLLSFSTLSAAYYLSIVLSLYFNSAYAFVPLIRPSGLSLFSIYITSLFNVIFVFIIPVFISNT